jgi:hypothetical protein
MHPSPRRAAPYRAPLAALVALVTLLAALGARHIAQAQPAAPQAAYTAYLPLVVAAGKQVPPTQPTQPPTQPTQPPTQPTTPPTQPTQPPTQPTVRGWFNQPEKKTGASAIAMDAQGGMHMAFRDHVPFADKPAAYYAYCPPPTSQCSDPAKWSNLSLGGPVDDVQLKLTPAGQPRMLVSASPEAGSFEKHYLYLECGGSCLDENNWGYVDVTYSYGNGASDVTGYYLPKRYFALDKQGRPRFVFYDGNYAIEPDRYGGYYAACDDDCLNQASWSVTRFTREDHSQTSYYETIKSPALTFTASNGPRIVAQLGPVDDPRWYMDPPLYYFACDAGCDDAASWQRARITGDAGGAYPAWDIALDANDRPRVAFFSYQGSAGSEKLFYLQCDAECTSDGSWQRVNLGLPSGAGTGANIELDALGRPRIAYLNSNDLGYSWCDTDCESPAAWQHRTVETSDELEAQYPVARPVTCDASTWDNYSPNLQLDAAGRPVVSYEGSYKARCYMTNPSNPSGPMDYYMHEIWHSVRVTFFAQ